MQAYFEPTLDVADRALPGTPRRREAIGPHYEDHEGGNGRARCGDRGLVFQASLRRT